MGIYLFFAINTSLTLLHTQGQVQIGVHQAQAQDPLCSYGSIYEDYLATEEYHKSVHIKQVGTEGLRSSHFDIECV